MGRFEPQLDGFLRVEGQSSAGIRLSSVGGQARKCLKLSVHEVLNRKHPDPQVPPKSAFLSWYELPKLEDVEVSSGQIMHVAQSIQGGADPGGCDANHWQDSLLCHGAHSSRLRESVACLCRRLANSIVP